MHIAHLASSKACKSALSVVWPLCGRSEAARRFVMTNLTGAKQRPMSSGYRTWRAVLPGVWSVTGGAIEVTSAYVLLHRKTQFANGSSAEPKSSEEHHLCDET
ncbi:hypothetical protein FIBSPDRAFT_894289 [Athelia psychrophila]|uniref:Uncharacterized protein n=1 Tax=Athelia psychrophila TaxID=1759441 RepID=A0A166G0S8_9AGAM|nr:hypothetical protein FIBSPDRAFT_894289 [Fibularhizoctonia sp. CBS 109695]